MYSWPGLGWAGGLVRGSRKSKFMDREAPSGKHSTCEKWPSTRLKITDSMFFRRNGPFGGWDAGANFTNSIFSEGSGCPWNSFRQPIRCTKKRCKGPSDSVSRTAINLSCWHSHPLLPHVNTDSFLPLTNPQCWRSHLEICWFALSCMDWHPPWPKWGFWYVHRIETEWKKNRVKEWKEHKLGFQNHVTNKCADVSHTFASQS